ncbi:MAG: hypothetical protein R2940_16800 [Syntrophotaleaceae bacterium]
MKLKSPQHHQRWTLRLFEWGVLTCILLVLMGVLLHKVRHLQAEAERLNVQATIENLRAAVFLASVLARDGSGQGFLADCNPVRILREQTGLDLPGYMGEIDVADADKISPGHWYFEQDRKALVYLLINADDFKSPLEGRSRIRLCIRENGESGTPMGLEACESYRWMKR